ncbi:MAG: glycosyltransferase family 39 protein [bacterium]
MKNKFFIILILVLTFFLRVWGMGYGLPHFLVGDEQSQVAGALRMAELKTLIPALHPEEFQLLYYPPLMSYLYLIYLTPLVLIKYFLGGFGSFTDFKNYLVINPAFLWLAARFLITLIGTASVYLIYLVGRKIFNKRSGILASLFLATSFFHLELSHFTRHWLPACFLTLLLVYLAWQIWQDKDKKYFVLSGAVAGLAFGITYVTAIAFLLPVFAYFFLGEGKFSQKIKNKNFWLMIGIFLLIAFIFIALYPQEFLKLTIGEDAGVKGVKNIIDYFGSFFYYFLNLLYFEPVILFFSLTGIVLLFLKAKEKLIFLLFFPFVYISLFYFLLHHEVRYTLPLLPFLILLASYGIDYLLNFLKSELAKTLIVLIVLVYPLSVGLKFDFLLSQKDTRLLALDWLGENISPNSKIIADLQQVKIMPTKEAIKLQESLAPTSLRTIDRTLLDLSPSKYPKPAYDVLDLHYLNKVLPESMFTYASENSYQYFIVSYWQKGELTNQDLNLISSGQLIKKFTSTASDDTYDFNGNYQGPAWVLFQMKNLGPIVEIYKL